MEPITIAASVVLVACAGIFAAISIFRSSDSSTKREVALPSTLQRAVKHLFPILDH